VLPIFGVFLVYTAVKLVAAHGADIHPERNFLMRIARRLVRVSRGDHSVHADHFFVRENGLLCITPLFLVLLVVESTDVIFAVDSIPAIFGITKDTFIIFTSNIFAILGLRALYFLLAGAMGIFRYLSYGLSAVLGFIGIGMVAEYVYEYWHVQPGEEHGHLIPIWLKLAVIVAALGFAIGLSVAVNRRDEREQLHCVDPSHADSEDEPRGDL
jgi:tellurite resistance protein TerC